MIHYFRVISECLPIHILDQSSSEWCDLAELSVFPEEIKGALRDHFSIYDPRIGLHVDPVARVGVRFDFVRYPHDILVHEQCGGGGGYPALQIFRLKPEVQGQVLARLRRMPREYRAIHIRNTDMRVDVSGFLDRIAPLVVGMPLLVCTDDVAALEETRRRLNGVELLTVAPIPDAQGRSLHYNPDIAGWELDVGVLTDLLAMARAQELILPAIAGTPISGFSRLAADLHRRPWILRSLLHT
ncbi:hypothetical protein [Synechococcus sp. CS-1328]|uniref:hypothetical protein n=1 Tax=Synechococcus sp. CS-1328 TaxID=2847976 RepID=UPI00223AF9A0|nr:hypothetical protein [Synechococcus sp. CS-1328]MCT0225911.1 hypothetical protein [Synechococcus sp. CS-1328]